MEDTQHKKKQVKTYSAKTLSMIIVNVVVGSGILWLPSAFADLSIGPSIIFTIVISFSSVMFARYAWDVTARTFALIRIGKLEDYTQSIIPDEDKDKFEISGDPEKASVLANASLPLGQTQNGSGCDPRNVELKNVETPGTEAHHENDETIVVVEVGVDNIGKSALDNVADFSVPNDRMLQFSEMCRTYFGFPGFILFQICLILYMVGTIWSYGQVISSSLTSVVPMTILPAFKLSGQKEWTCSSTDAYGQMPWCNHSYLIWCTILFVYCLVMVFLNVAEQKYIQQFSTVVRFVQMFIVMAILLYCNFNAYFGTTNESGDWIDYDHSSHNSPSLKSWSFTMSGMGDLFSSVAFSQICHDSIPQIFRPVAQQSQKYIGHSITASYIAVIFFTFMIGISGAYIFGNDGRGLVTLNFTTWSGNSFDPALASSATVFIKILSYLIRILPSVYIITSVPINILTLSYNVKALFPEKVKEKKWVHIFSHLISTIPPFILAYTLNNLGVIISFSGLFCFGVLLAPSFCVFKAKRICKREFGIEKTPFSGLDQNYILFGIWALYLFGFISTTWYLVETM